MSQELKETNLMLVEGGTRKKSCCGREKTNADQENHFFHLHLSWRICAED